MGFAFPKDERASLVAADPEKFHLPITSDLRYNWVRTWLACLDPDEMRELIVDAWSMCARKSVVTDYFRSQGMIPMSPELRAGTGRGDRRGPRGAVSGAVSGGDGESGDRPGDK